MASLFRGLSLSELARPDVAARYLGDCLRRGELALLLGAGVSRSSELPSWRALVEGCERSVGMDIPEGERSSADLMNAMEAVRRTFRTEGQTEERFRELVRRNLYPQNYLDEGTYPDELLRNLMMIAIGALVMPSSRGSVREVLTLNFDDLLEWYLRLHGFTSQSVTELPQVIRSDVDVTVFHAHGFIPLTGESTPTDWMVLTHQEFVRRIAGTTGRAWPRFLTNLFATKRLLTVGTSMSDIDLHVHLEEANHEKSAEDPSGFVINSKFQPGEIDSLRSMRLVPVEVESREAIPHFLLQICRNASTGSAS